MKVLHVVHYITSNCHPAFLRNQTGFGYMVHDIAEYTAKSAEVELFAVMCHTPKMDLDGFTVVGCSWGKLFANFSWRSIRDAISFLSKYKLPLKESLRTFYIYLSMGQLEKIAKDYDIIHIHGCTALTDAAIKVCQRKQKSFLVTLHGLNSFSDEIKLHPSLKQYERDFLAEAAVSHYPVSFISSGNRMTAINSVGASVDSFYVVSNGCDVTIYKSLLYVRSAYNIKSNEFVFCFVGNVSKNKNQYQVARAWSLLPNEYKQRCKVLFVGNYKEDDEVVAYIHENRLQDNLILCGMQPKDKVASFYQACDATILTSVSEGFGLSIIEGFVYGKPNVTFRDLPAAKDLYDENAMVFANERTDEALAEAMQKVMCTTFDKEKIILHAEQFSFEIMAERYIKLYKKIVHNKY